MKILITGGAGFIGTHLRKKLITEGNSVRVFDNLIPQVHGDDPSIDFSDCEFIRGDVREFSALSKAMAGIDVVYHLAAETGVGQSQYEIERYISTNTLGTAVALQAAVNSNVQQFIVTSSRAVYGEGTHACPQCDNRFVPASRKHSDLQKGIWEIACPACGTETQPLAMSEQHTIKPISIYGLTKVQQEQIGEQVRQVYPMPVTNLRLFNVFGPGQSLGNPYVGVLGTFFRRISSGEGIDIYEDGQMRRDFVYVGDVVEVLHRVNSNQKAFDRTLNVGNGVPVTLEQAGKEMFALLGKEARMDFSGKFRVGDIHHAVADTALIGDILNYVPETPFLDGLRQFVDWAMEKSHDGSGIDAAAEHQLKERNLLLQAYR